MRLHTFALLGAWAPVSIFVGCSDDLECGSGTREADGVCISSSTDLVDGNRTVCGPGTELRGNSCVPVASLGSFGVVARPVECDVVVDNVTPVATTVTALDPEGTPLTSFSGTLSLIGVGGITVSPSTVTLNEGTGTTNVTVSGLTPNAQIVAFDASATVTGRSDPFPVIEERVRLVSLTGPTSARSGEPFDLTALVETNACRAPHPTASGSIFLSTNGPPVSPGQILVDGTASITQAVSIDGSGLSTTTPVTVTAQIGVSDEASTTVSVIPPIVFSGIADAIAVDSTTARITFEAALGGAPPYTYTVFRSTSEGVLGDALPARLIDTQEGEFSIADGTDGDTFFFAVRVVDSLGSELDQNRVQAGVLKGPVRFVDASNSGIADGGAGTPFTTIADAVESLSPDGGTVYVSLGTYAELPQDFSIVSGLQLIGGFSGFVDSTTTATDWVRSAGRSSLEYDGASLPDARLLALGGGAVLSGFEVGASFSGNATLVDGVGRLDVRGSRLGSTDPSNAGQRINHASGALNVLNSEILASPLTLACVGSQDTVATLAGLVTEGCHLNIAANLDEVISVTVLNSSFRNAGRGLSVNNGVVTIRGSTFVSIVGTAVELDEGELDVDRARIRDGQLGIAQRGLGGLILTRSQFVDMEGGVSTFVRSAEGERRPMRILNNRFETTRQPGVSFSTSDITGVYDVEIRDNTFVWQGEEQGVALSVFMDNEESALSGTFMVRNNQIFDFPDGIDLFLREGNLFTGEPVSLLLDISQNYARSTVGYGTGIYADFRSSGSMQATARGNLLRGFQNRSVDLRGGSFGEATIDMTDNVSESIGRRRGGGIFTTLFATEPGVLTVQNNRLSGGEGYLGATMSLEARQDLAAIVTDNVVASRSTVRVDRADALIARNRVEGFVASLDVQRDEDIQVNRNSNTSIVIEDNTVLGEIADLAVSVNGNSNRVHNVTILGNEVQSLGDFGYSGSVDFSWGQNNTTSGAVGLTVSGNTFDGVSVDANLSAATSVGNASPVDFRFTDNVVRTAESSSSGDIRFNALAQTSDLAMTIEGNVFDVAGDGTTQFTANMTNTNANGSFTIAENVFNHGGSSTALTVEILNNQAGGSIDAEVRNNLIRQRTGYSSEFGLETSTSQSVGSASLDIVHNTILGEFSSAGLQVARSDAQGLTTTIQDNIVASTGEDADSIVVSGSNGGALVINNNLVNTPSGEDNADLLGEPAFVNPVERETLLLVVDPINNEVESVAAVLNVGDRVVLADSVTVRTVIASVPPFATLDGETFATMSGTVERALVWSEATFVAPLPDYSLLEESLGSSAATDGTDVGSSGGSDPL